MKIKITSRKFKAKDILKEFIEDEAKRLERFDDGILDVDVVLSFIHNKDSIKNAEIKVKLPKKVLVANESSEEFTKSVTLAVEKLIRQIKQLKSKKKSQIKDEQF
ncbi:MAG: ribosomal subunit interface protein [Ignavibacteriales bacterium CG_4_9_14_3_um_filter_34_10]|nr:MAG: ribosomal subunit interface protein [Ignavibacteriales bacterium CG_4_9_14_3_um_filter_34_10]